MFFGPIAPKRKTTERLLKAPAAARMLLPSWGTLAEASGTAPEAMDEAEAIDAPTPPADSYPDE